MNNWHRRSNTGLFGVTGLMLCLTGCVVAPMYSPGKLDLKKYQSLTVHLFEMGPEVTMPPEKNELMCDQIVKQVSKASGQPFSQVARGLPSGKEDELVVHGVITKYEPGSQLARFLLFIAGPASLEAQVQLKDAASGEVLSDSPVKSFFGLGGIIGGLVSADDVVRDFGAEIGRGVVRAKKASK